MESALRDLLNYFQMPGYYVSILVVVESALRGLKSVPNVHMVNGVSILVVVESALRAEGKVTDKIEHTGFQSLL